MPDSPPRAHFLALALAFGGCGDKDALECGPGTHEVDGACLPDESDTDTDSDTDSDTDTDTDSDTDTDTDSDTDSDTDTDTDSDTDTDAGPCAPPDSWTGPIDTSLYTSVPYDASYDAGLSDLEADLPSGSVSTSGGASYLIYGATVVAVDREGSWFTRMVVADAHYSISIVLNESETALVGDTVGFSTSWLGARYDSAYVERTSGWTVLDSSNPVYVAELGSANVDYYAARNQLMHVYGEITGTSAHECETWSLDCYVLEHDGTEDYIRVPTDNAWGLDVDYSGGLCAEIVAPVNVFSGSTGTVEFLDVSNSEWMRVWEVPR